MKLEGLALTALATFALTLSSACANGGPDAPHHVAGAGANPPPASGGGSSAGEAGAAYDAGTADTYNPFATDSGGGATDAPTVPVTDTGVTTDGGLFPACGLQATAAACATCCSTSIPASVNPLNAAIMACTCGTSGTCSTECASEVCVGVPATSGDACYSCLAGSLGSGGSCYTPVQTACLADPSCAEYLSCEAAECKGKP